MDRKPEEAYNGLIERFKRISLLGSCASVLQWDERTYLPKKGTLYRAEQLGLLAGIVHDQATDPGIETLLCQIENSNLVSGAFSVAEVNVREIRREYNRRVKLPRSLVEELARVTTLAQNVWQEARRDSNFKMFLPHLEKVLELKRQEAEALEIGKTAYDALLDEYEPGETAANLTVLFAGLRDELVGLVSKIVASKRKPDLRILSGNFPVPQQMAFGKAVATKIGFDFEAGRLDETTHPFCSGLGPGDTRITTRYDRYLFSQAFFGILHEAGHGLYEQGLDQANAGTPMGFPVSLGIHESQSRMWENFVGRSSPFWIGFFPEARKAFPEALKGVTAEAFIFAINHVEPSFVRVEADEATYNLHILLRFELEQALIDGQLSAADLPGAWNEKFERYFGLSPPDDARGCLQDIHWSSGGIGYFPTYTLGNLYAAQFFEQALEDLEDLLGEFESGKFLSLKDWLTQKIFLQGQRYRAGELVKKVTGKQLSYRALMDYLETKYSSLYGI